MIILAIFWERDQSLISPGSTINHYTTLHPPVLYFLLGGLVSYIQPPYIYILSRCSCPIKPWDRQMHWQSRSRARQTTPIRGFGADASLQCNDTNQQCNDVILQCNDTNLQCKTMTWTNALSCCYCSSSESNSISSLALFDSYSSSKTCIELSDQMMICQLAIVAEEAHCNQTSFQWSSFLIYKI